MRYLLFLFSILMISPALASNDKLVVGEITNLSIEPIVWKPFAKGRDLYLNYHNDDKKLGGFEYEIITLDDKGDPAQSSRMAEELIHRDGVHILAGSAFSHTGLAISAVAKKEKTPFLATWASADDFVWAKGHPHAFRILPGIYTGAKALGKIAKDQHGDLPNWASVGFSFEDGRSGMKTYKETLGDVNWVSEHWPKLKGLDAGVTINAVQAENPDALALFLFGPDLAKFIRQGRPRGLFNDKPIYGIEMGYGLTLEPLGEDIVEGWYVSGYPWYAVDNPEHKAFVKAYQEAYGENPNVGALGGYITYQAIDAALEKVKSLDSDNINQALTGLKFNTPLGELYFRTQDNALSIGTWVGRTAYIDGHARMTDIQYIPIEQTAPSDEWIKQQRGGH